MFSEAMGSPHTVAGLMEGVAGFEPAAFCCAADVLPEAPNAHIHGAGNGVGSAFSPPRYAACIVAAQADNLCFTGP